MEAELYQEYKSRRKRGLQLKGFWFKTTGRQLFKEMDPEAQFQFSDGWFDGFKERHRISFGHSTDVLKTNQWQGECDEIISQEHSPHCTLTGTNRDGEKIRVSSSGTCRSDTTALLFRSWFYLHWHWRQNRLGLRLWIWAGEEAMYHPNYLVCRWQGQSQAPANF